MRTIKTISKKSICIILLAALCNISAAQIIYVDDDATGANDGSLWENAYVYLQDALADANDSNKPVEIRVAQGVYKPDQGAGQTPGDREATFQLINGVTLVGGYAGASDPNVRDFELYETILSGDLNGDDIEIADPFDLLYETTRAENSYHVVTGNNTDETAILAGCTITGGNADLQEGEEYNRGGGYFSDSGSPLIRDCVFTGNICLNYGAGIYLSGQCQAVIRDCQITSNCSADDGGGMFIKNDFGLYDCNPLIACCVIENNRASDGGGGIRCDDNTVPTIRSCIVAGNTSVDEGGGLSLKWQCSPKIENCTIVANVSGYGGGIYCIETDVEMVNCILWANRANYGNQIAIRLLQEEEYRTYTRLSVSYCDVEGGRNDVYIDKDCELCWSLSNIELDPCFAESSYWDPNSTPEDPNDDLWIDGDYHLKSQAGRWDPNTQTWVLDDVTSPCIDAGDPNMPVGDEPEPNGGRINMGAYGGTKEASMSLETGGLSLPDVAYIYLDKHDTAESFRSLLESYGCPTTLIKTKNVTATLLESCDLVIVADDTFYSHAWTEPNAIAAIEDSGKPIVGLGDGGYDFFGRLGLSIGSPHGLGNNHNSIYVIDPAYSLFSTPYPIDIPQDGVLQLYTETRNVALYFWPDIPETVVVIAAEPGNSGYYPLAMEHYQYLLWGFTESPDKMTETGKKLFINVVIWTANAGWESEN